MKQRSLQDVPGDSLSDKMLSLTYEALMTEGHSLKPLQKVCKGANGKDHYVPIIIVTDPKGEEYLIDWNKQDKSSSI